MKLHSVTANNRRRTFEVITRAGTYSFPYVKCEPAPSPDDRLTDVYVDSELGNEGFTYVLASGAEGSVMLDSVLDHNADPQYLADLDLYYLTVAAKEGLEASGRSVRDVARALGTSPPQLYRLLDTANYTKSARQLLSLLALLGYRVELTDREPAAARRATPWHSVVAAGTGKRVAAAKRRRAPVVAGGAKRKSPARRKVKAGA